MEIGFKLAINYLKRNKKRTIATIIGIAIVTILLIGVLLLFQTYQDYMISLIRNTDNWEVKFTNIPYGKVYGLTNNSDIENISLVHDMGISEEIDKGKYIVQEYIHLKAYNLTAMENLGIDTVEGRLPREDDEIAISQNLIIEGESITSKVGNHIKFMINDQEKEYKIVGIVKPPKFEELTLKVQNVAAITYLNESNLPSNTMVEASVNWKKLNQVYSKSKEMIQVLQLGENEGNIEYNTDLLHYSGIWNMNDEEDLKIIGIMLFFIILIVMIAITFIYSIFNISIQERKREFANLNSIGATKRQIFGIIIKEATIMLVIAIFIGLIFSLFVQKAIIGYANNSLTNQIEMQLLEHIPYGKILVAIFITTVTTYISVLKPAFKASKTSTMMILKGDIPNIKISKGILKREEKRVEEKLAIRNTECHKKKYIMLILTTTLSIFLFLVTQGYLKNMYHGTESEPDNYTVNVNKAELLDEIIQDFEATGAVKSMSAYHENNMFVYIEESKLSQPLKQAVQELPELKDRIFTSVDNEFWCKLIALPEKEYISYLKQIGLKELKNNECIFVNYDNLRTKYYDGLYITNYEIGDTIEVYAHSKKDAYSKSEFDGNANSLKGMEFIEYGDNQKKIKLNIAKVANTLPKGMKSFSNDNRPTICMIVNYDTLFDISWKLSIIDIKKEEHNLLTTISINATDRKLLDSALQQIAAKHKLNNYDVAWTSYIDDENKVAEKRITQIFLYSFLTLIVVITVINIINVVINDANLRLKDFAVLKSVGMSKKQFNKMIFSEYFSYLGTATILGILLSFTVICAIYLFMDDHEFYNFQIPYLEIISVIILMSLILWGILKYINRKITKNDIINLIKRESV